MDMDDAKWDAPNPITITHIAVGGETYEVNVLLWQRCADCQHWQDWDDRFKDSSLKSCRSPHLHRQIHWRHVLESMPAPNEAAVEYDEDWGLVTGPDFGCVHFKQR